MASFKKTVEELIFQFDEEHGGDVKLPWGTSVEIEMGDETGEAASTYDGSRRGKRDKEYKCTIESILTDDDIETDLKIFNAFKNGVEDFSTEFTKGKRIWSMTGCSFDNYNMSDEAGDESTLSLEMTLENVDSHQTDSDETVKI
jgi:hypothetical protein